MKNYLAFRNDFKGFQLSNPKVKSKTCNKISTHKLKIHITDITQVLKFQMFRWMLPEWDLWIAHEHSGVQVDASTERLVPACEHPETTIQMDTEAEGLAEEPE